MGTSNKSKKDVECHASEVSLQLSMSVVEGQSILADLLLSGTSTPKTLTVASSPLFGPVVDGVTKVDLCSAEEVNKALDTALKAADVHVRSNSLECTSSTLIVANAIVKIVQGDDVFVASLFASVAQHMHPYLAVIDKEATAPRLLFSHAFGGPCSTLVMAVVEKTVHQDITVETLNGQRIIAHIRTSGTRSGSVKDFVKYAKVSLTKANESAAKTTNSKEKAHM
uniref:Aconitate hydratase n=1 Tax=Lygus hesperus TaxID=30085 RepID=A0A0A9WHR5_LYGHE